MDGLLAAGWTIAYGPELAAPMAHRRSAGLTALYQRITREAQAMVSLGAAEPLTGADALRAWWSSFPSPSNKPTFVRRASPYRMAELAGAWRGSRLATELDGPRLPDLLARSGHGSPAEPYLPWI